MADNNNAAGSFGGSAEVESNVKPVPKTPDQIRKEMSDVVNAQLEKCSKERIKLKCLHCGADFDVHAPVVIQKETPIYSFFEILPSWSLTERSCPKCHTVHYPTMSRVEVSWISVHPEDNKKSQIVTAGAAKPMTPEQMRQLQHNINRG
jgi:hypothetical protein